jgi:hypothetical protein
MEQSMNEHDRELNDGLAAKMDRKLEQGAWDARQKIALACRMLAHGNGVRLRRSHAQQRNPHR